MECSNENHGVSVNLFFESNLIYVYIYLNIYVYKSLERELIGCFLLKMTDKQVVSARSGWYVDKRTLRREFDQHIFSEPNSTELRIKLSLNGAFNVSGVNKSLLQLSM